ncbi:MAG: glycosyltransferase [Bacteroidetes bacterium]|nr:glycosyltransferase [Bacteroidota bacterium]
MKTESKNAEHPLLSVVCTIYRAEQVIDNLVSEIVAATGQLPCRFEIILVDDHSPDLSWEKIEETCRKYSFVKGIKLSRNFGQQIAMSAGMRYAAGDYILIMDGDLQNPPSEIPRLYNKIMEGFDIIYCASKTRNDFADEWSSRLFWFLLARIFNVKIIKNQLMMKIMTKKFVEHYNMYNEINRTVSGIVQDIGLKYDVLEVQNRKRHSGKSNYNVLRRFNLMIDVVISLSTAPLNFMIYLGLFIFLFTIAASAWYFARYFFYDIAPGFTSIILTLFFFGGIIILMLGFIGRYLANIYTEVRQRPLFLINKMVNFQIVP